MSVDDIRFKRLGYVALNVTDLDRAQAFYIDKIGLTGEAADDAVFLRCSPRHHDLSLHLGAEPGLKRLGWEMEDSAALQAARTHFTEQGLNIVAVTASEAEKLGIGEAFRIEEPTTGATFEFFTDMIDADRPYVSTHTKIARLGHVVLNSPNRPLTEQFMLEHMNFRVSDRIDGVVTFMRCFPNPYHHSFGVSQGKSAQLHHVNFMVTELADIGKGNNRMKQNGIPIVFGPGKHPPSESIFLYFLDPDGLTLEYSFGMEEFPEQLARNPRDMPAGIESVDYWGGRPERGMAKVGAIEQLIPG